MSVTVFCKLGTSTIVVVLFVPDNVGHEASLAERCKIFEATPHMSQSDWRELTIVESYIGSGGTTSYITNYHGWELGLTHLTPPQIEGEWGGNRLDGQFYYEDDPRLPASVRELLGEALTPSK